MSRPRWWLDPTDLDVLALCEHLAERGPNAVPDHVDDFTPPSGNTDTKQLVGIAESEHYVRTDVRFQDLAHSHDPVAITVHGRRHIDEVRERRTRTTERVAAARQGLLQWAYDHAIENADLPMNNPSRFLAADPPYNFWGAPFTENDVREATETLLDHGLLELFGERLASGAAQNIKITGAGKACIEQYDGAVGNYLRRQSAPSAPTYNQTFNAPFNGQNAQGNHNTQTQNNGINAVELAAIINGLRDLLAQVENPDDREDLTTSLDVLHEAAQAPTPNIEDVTRRANMLNRLAARTGDAALGAAVAAATTGLIDLAGTLT